MTGFKVEVYDGKHHPVDSKEVAFITAGKRAFIEAVQKAKPALLEPFVTVEITAPRQYMGESTGTSRQTRAGAGHEDAAGRYVHGRGEAPLGELQTFSTELKSITGGAGSYSMEYSHDEPCPPHVQQEVIAAFAGHAEEE